METKTQARRPKIEQETRTQEHVHQADSLATKERSCASCGAVVPDHEMYEGAEGRVCALCESAADVEQQHTAVARDFLGAMVLLPFIASALFIYTWFLPNRAHPPYGIIGIGACFGVLLCGKNLFELVKEEAEARQRHRAVMVLSALNGMGFLITALVMLRLYMTV